VASLIFMIAFSFSSSGVMLTGLSSVWIPSIILSIASSAGSQFEDKVVMMAMGVMTDDDDPS
jgi:hypothetical protein